MRKVIGGAFISLDGVLQAPGGPEMATVFRRSETRIPTRPARFPNGNSGSSEAGFQEQQDTCRGDFEYSTARHVDESSGA
jgi:hypothetical protein